MEKKVREIKEFKEFENDILETEDDFKLALVISTKFNDWPYKDKPFIIWKKILSRIQRTLENILKVYYKEGLQHKNLDLKDKTILIAFLRFLQRILFFLKDEGELDFIDSIMYLALSFDSDISIQAFKVLMLLSSVENISVKCSIHMNILKSLAGVNKVRLKNYSGLKNLGGEAVNLENITDDVYETFDKFRTNYDIVDLYVKISNHINKPLVQDIIKIYATILLSNQSINKDYFYDKMKLSPNAIKLEQILKVVKECDLRLETGDNLEINAQQFLDVLDYSDFEIDNLDIDINGKDVGTFLRKNVGIISNILEEAKFALDNFILFHFEYDYDFSQIFLILEMDNLDGYFYSHFRKTLDNSCFETLLWFSVFEIFLHENRTDSLNIKYIIEKYSTAVCYKPSDMTYRLLSVCYNYLKSCNCFFDEFVKEKIHFLLIEWIRNFHSIYDPAIVKLYIKILFAIYKKENSGLEPFEDSTFFKVLCIIVSQENSRHTSQAIAVVNYFLNFEPSSITKVTNTIFGDINLLYKYSYVKMGVVVAIVHLFDALSLNLEYGIKLRKEKSFTLFLEDTFKLPNVKSIFKNYVINDAIQELLRHHPEYIEECYEFIESSFKNFQVSDVLKKIDSENSELLKVFILFILIIRPFMMDHIGKFNEKVSTKLFELYCNDECSYKVIFNLNDSFCNFFKDPSIVDEKIISNLNGLILNELEHTSSIISTMDRESIEKESCMSLDEKIVSRWGSIKGFLDSFTKLERILYIHSFLAEEQNNSRIILDFSKEKILKGLLLVINYVNTFPRQFPKNEKKGLKTFSERFREVRKVILDCQDEEKSKKLYLRVLRSVYYGSLDIISHILNDHNLFDIYFENINSILEILENLREGYQISHKRRKMSYNRNSDIKLDYTRDIFSDEENTLNDDLFSSNNIVDESNGNTYKHVMFCNLKTFLNIVSNSINKLSCNSVDYIINWLQNHKVLCVNPIIPLEEQIRLVYNLSSRSEPNLGVEIKKKIVNFLLEIKIKYVSVQSRIIDIVNLLFATEEDVPKGLKKALFSIYKNNFHEATYINCDCISGNEKSLIVLFNKKMFNNINLSILEEYLDLPYIDINYNFKLDKYSFTLLSKIIFILTYRNKKIDYPLVERLFKKIKGLDRIRSKEKCDSSDLKECLGKITHKCGRFKVNYDVVYDIIDQIDKIEDYEIERKDVLRFMCNVLRYSQTFNCLLDYRIQRKMLDYILKYPYSKTNMTYVQYLFTSLFDVFTSCYSYLTRKDGMISATYDNLSLLYRSPNLILDVSEDIMVPSNIRISSSFYYMQKHMDMMDTQERLFYCMFSTYSSKLFVLQISVELLYNNPRYLKWVDEEFVEKILKESILKQNVEEEEKPLIETYYLLLVMLLQDGNERILGILFKEFEKIIENDDLLALYKLFFVLQKSLRPLSLKMSFMEKNNNKENVVVLAEKYLDSGILDKILDKIPSIDVHEFKKISQDLKSDDLIYKNPKNNDNQIYLGNGFSLDERFNLSTSIFNDDLSNVLSNEKNGMNNIFVFIKYVLKLSYEDKIEHEYNFESENSYEQDSDDLNSNDQMEEDGAFYVEESYNSNRLSSSIMSEVSEEEILEEKDTKDNNQSSEVEDESSKFEIHSTFMRIGLDYYDVDNEIKKWLETKFKENIKESGDFKENLSRSTSYGDTFLDVENSNVSDDFFRLGTEIHAENEQESFSVEEEDEDERSIGIEGGEIPDISVEFLNTMGEEEITCFVQLTNEERRARSLYYVPLDKNFLESLDERVRRIFIREEILLEESYFEREDSETFSEHSLEDEIQDIDIKIDHKSVIKLVEYFLKYNSIRKQQFKGIIEVLLYNKELRNEILECSRKLLFDSYYKIFYQNEKYEKHIEILKRVLNNFYFSYEKFRKSQLEVKYPLFTRDLLIHFLRFEDTWDLCLWIILKLHEKNIGGSAELSKNGTCADEFKELSLNVDTLSIAQSMIERYNFCEEKSKIISSFLEISRYKLNKRIYNLVSDAIEKIFQSHFNAFFCQTFLKVEVILQEIYSLQRRSFLSLEFLEKQEVLKNLVFFLKTSLDGWIEHILSISHYRNQLELFFDHFKIDNRDFKHTDFKLLRGLSKNFDYDILNKEYHTANNQNGIQEFLCPEVVKMLYSCLSNDVFNIQEIDSSIDITLNGVLLNSYFTLFNIAEMVSNFIIIFRLNGDVSASFDHLSLYEENRREFIDFLEAKMDEVNEILKNENKIFRDNIFFLSRFNVINYNNKQEFIRNKIKKMKIYKDGSYTVVVRRRSILDDSFFQVMNKTPKEFRSKKMQIKFSGEEGLDFGGLTKEWLDLILKEILNPNYGLFVHSSEKKTIVHPFKKSDVNSEHLTFYRFIGRIIAKVILDGYNIDLHLDRSVYKYFLGKRYDISDLEINDPQFYNSLIWIRDNPINDVLNLTFSTDYLEFGESVIVDLKPNGRNLSVTDENKREYLDLVVEYRLFKGIESQINAIKTGIFEILSEDLLSIFNEKELELLIAGIPDINVDDWINNTNYYGYTKSSQNILWFWKAIKSFSPEEKAKLLQFSTGSSRLPYEGFSHLQGNNGLQKFSIHRTSSDGKRLPSAHTCFNQLDLPEYKNYNDLRKSILYAINECTEGFGLV